MKIQIDTGIGGEATPTAQIIGRLDRPLARSRMLETTLGRPKDRDVLAPDLPAPDEARPAE